MTPSPITDRLLFSLKKQNLPQILRIFCPPLPERCGTFCYLLHENLAVRAGFISEVVNVVLHIPIVTECFNHTRIFTTPLSPSSVTLLGPSPFGRLLPSTVSRPSHPIPRVNLVSATPREQRFHPSHNSSKKNFKRWGLILTSLNPFSWSSSPTPADALKRRNTSPNSQSLAKFLHTEGRDLEG